MDLCDVNKTIAQNESVAEQPAANSESSIVQSQPQPIEEMLGSVTTYNNVEGSEVFGSSKNCQQLRTSARVFKKMKLDSALAVPVSPVIDKEKNDVILDIKTEVKRSFRPQWCTEDKDIFFQALNEYGKDFDSIQQHINNKIKKKGLPDSLIKNKEQVRCFYQRTWNKVSKYLKCSDDIKKVPQELYALINYGELRKKVGSVSEKILMKLNELIYRGTVNIRTRGKTIRIKTPMCRALRKLNELEEKHEDLKLPTRVLVELRPKNMETWLQVQFMSQNPRLRISLPLQRRLSALLNCVNERWKTQLAKAHEQVHSFTNSTSDCSSSSCCTQTQGPILRVAPKSGASVEVPTINLSEYLRSFRISLNAYEERIGVKVPGEQLWSNMCASFKGGGKGAMKKGAPKRQRNESTGEKEKVEKDKAEKEKAEKEKAEKEKAEKEKVLTNTGTTTTVTTKQEKICDDLDETPTRTVSDDVDTAINTILSLQLKPEDISPDVDVIKEETETCKTENLDPTFPTCKEEEISRIKSGWTLENCGTLTIGEMYLMFGHDSKLELEYYWDPPDRLKTEPQEVDAQSEVISDDPIPEPNNCETNSEENTKIKIESSDLSVTLKKLLSLAKLHYRKERLRCPCGHICGGPKTNSASRNKSLVNKTNQKTVSTENVNIASPPNNCMRNVTVKTEPMFRKPAIFPSNDAGTESDSFRAQLDSLQRKKYTNRKGRPGRSKNVVVERMLPLLPKPLLNGHSLVTMKVISQTDRSKLRPIAPRIDENTTESESTAESTNNGIEFFTAVETTEETETTEEQTLKTSEERDRVTSPTRVASPASISNFLDLSITCGDTNDLIAAKDTLTSFAGLLNDPDSNPLSSPSRILKENEHHWLNSEVNDYSLTSLLGHLESPMKATAPVIIPCDDVPITQDIDSQFPSLLGENGVDFVDQFVDMAAQVDTEPTEIGN